MVLLGGCTRHGQHERLRLIEWPCMQISGYLVPKGTEVMMSSWSLHYNKGVWGEDAAQWRPDRWLEGGSVPAARKDADGNLQFQPFLTGVSNCVGQHLAMVRPLTHYVLSVTLVVQIGRDAVSRGMLFGSRGQCIHRVDSQAELKMVVASLVSRLHVAVDAQRMPHLRTVEDYVGEAVTRITLQRSSPCWLRMRPRVPVS